MRRWIPNGIALFQKTRAFNKFSWEQKKKSKEIFLLYKNMEDTIKSQIQEPWIYLLVKSQNSLSQFSVELLWRKYNEKLHFRIYSSPMLKSCWIHSKNSYFFSYCSDRSNELWSETYKTENCSKSRTSHLQVFCKMVFLKNLLNSQKYTCVWVSFIIRLQVNFGKNLWAIFVIEQLRTLLLKMKVFLSFKTYNKGNIDF